MKETAVFFKSAFRKSKLKLLVKTVVLTLGISIAVPQLAWATFTQTITYRSGLSGTVTSSTTCAAATTPGPVACTASPISVTRYEYTSNNTNLWQATGFSSGSVTATKVLVSDHDDFTLSGDTLTFTNNPNFEAPTDSDTNNTYVVSVDLEKTINPGAVLYKARVTFTITIQNVVDETAPVISGGYSGGSFYENTAGYNSGFIYDFDASEAVTWNLSGPDAPDFEINSNGVLSWKDTGFYSVPDYDNPRCGAGNNSNSCQVVIEATDGATFPYTVTRTINLTVLNDAPSVYGYYGYNLADYLNDNSDFYVGYVVAYDRVTSWSLSGPDSDKFELRYPVTEGNQYATIDVHPKPGVIFDFETPNDSDENGLFEVEVTGEDFQGASMSTSFYFGVDNVSDETAPLVVGPASVSVLEGYEPANKIATYQVPNEPYGFFAYLTGDDSGFFDLVYVDSKSFNIRFNSTVLAKDYADFNGDNVFDVTIVVDDLTNGRTDQNITLFPIQVTLVSQDLEEEESSPTPEEVAEQALVDSLAESRMLKEFFDGLASSTESAVAADGLTGVKSVLLTYLGLPGVNADNVGAVLAAYGKDDATATLAEFKDFAFKYSVLSRLSDPALAKGVTVTDLVNAGLLPSGTSVDGLLMLKLRETPLEQRDTVAELQALILALK